MFLSGYLRNIMIPFLVIFIAFVGQMVQARGKVLEPVTVVLSANKLELDKNGKAYFKNVESVRPDDIIEYRAIYTNNTSGDIKNLVATLPIPTNTTFLEKFTPTPALASVDGVNYSVMPLMRKEGLKTVVIPLSEYRGLRWKISSLPAGKSVVVSAQARVNSFINTAFSQ